jgi:hypothetical protein
VTNHQKLFDVLREREREIYVQLFREQGVVIGLRTELEEVQAALIEVNTQLERERLSD